MSGAPSTTARISFSRRRFLASSAAGAGALLLPGLTAKAGAAAAPTNLRAAPATAALGDGMEVPVWAFNGRVPGPEIRVRQGDSVRVLLDNAIEQPTTIHWHGIRIDNAMDGVPDLTQAAVEPGEKFDYVFTAPDAGTFWYHSHKRSSEQVGRGLYGLLVVEETRPYPVDRELPLVIDDWRLNNLGEIDPSFGNLHDIAHGGRLGNWITVNGTSTPDIPVVRGERLRLRVANTANARIMTLHFKDLAPWAIAVDGQPLPPVRLAEDKLTLAPGQRTDLVIDVALEPGARAPVSFVDERGVLELAHLAADRAPGQPPRTDPPPPLPANPLDADLDLSGAHRAELVMSGGAMGGMRSAVFDGREMPMRELVNHGLAWAFNGVAGMTHEPLFRVERGRTVVVEMINDNRWPHAMHVHGHHFRVIARNDEELSDSPWRDTTLVYGFDRSRLAFVADNPGKWLIHCHMLEHSAGGMMTWFEVT